MIKVLIVEDDPMVAEFNKLYLERVNGFELIATTATVNQALETLENREIDLILLDIFMPGTNGLELMSQIREMGKGVDVIVVSAASDAQSINRALRYGAVDYLIKPFEFERFKAALNTYRDRISTITDQEILSQADLDKQILHKTHTPVSAAELPKGLNRNTLKTVWQSIQKMDARPFTTEEIANLVGISRVSMRKYLIFLNEIGILQTKIIYGTIGRPLYKHQYIPSQKDLLGPYL